MRKSQPPAKAIELDAPCSSDALPFEEPVAAVLAHSITEFSNTQEIATVCLTGISAACNIACTRDATIGKKFSFDRKKLPHPLAAAV